MTPCPLSFAAVFNNDVLSPLPSSITLSTAFLARPCKITQWSQRPYAYADDMGILNRIYREVQVLLEAVEGKNGQ